MSTVEAITEEDVRKLIILAEWAVYRSIFSVCLLYELSGLPNLVFTRSMNTCASRNFKENIRIFKSLFKDSKIVRKNELIIVDKLTKTYLFALDIMQESLKSLNNFLTLSESFTYDDESFRESLNTRIENLESNANKLARILDSIIEFVIENITNKYEIKTKHKPDISLFDQSHEKFWLNLPQKVDLNLIDSIENGDLMHSIASLDHFLYLFLCFCKIEVLEKNIKCIEKNKKLSWSLKLGNGIDVYVKIFESQIDLNDVKAIKDNLIVLKSLLDTHVHRNITAQLPKGTRDLHPNQNKIRSFLIDELKKIFVLYGAEEIDTPIFELSDTLKNKYGEDTKLIYDLKDQGGELLSLRYDLTVPLARYCALHGVEKLKRYHIGKVYRRDEPQLNRGRYREFFQCDFDIVGHSDNSLAELEVLTVLDRCLSRMQNLIGDYIIKVNNRKLLDQILIYCGVVQQKMISVCSSIDKLDKEPWEVVSKEMIVEKDIPKEVVDKLQKFVTIKGDYNELNVKLKLLPNFVNNSNVSMVLNEFQLLEDYFGKNRLEFNLSLARGLDYYTGIIFEACSINEPKLGSIAGGGRYDNLISMLSSKSIPTIGMSVGIERIFSVFFTKYKIDSNIIQIHNDRNLNLKSTLVYVVTKDSVPLKKRHAISEMIRTANIPAEYSLKRKVNIRNELQYTLDNNIRFFIVIGDDENKNNLCSFKDISKSEHEIITIEAAIELIKDCRKDYNELSFLLD